LRLARLVAVLRQAIKHERDSTEELIFTAPHQPMLLQQHPSAGKHSAGTAVVLNPGTSATPIRESITENGKIRLCAELRLKGAPATAVGTPTRLMLDLHLHGR
jgi:hypothetical protein